MFVIPNNCQVTKVSLIMLSFPNWNKLRKNGVITVRRAMELTWLDKHSTTLFYQSWTFMMPNIFWKLGVGMESIFLLLLCWKNLKLHIWQQIWSKTWSIMPGWILNKTFLSIKVNYLLINGVKNTICHSKLLMVSKSSLILSNLIESFVTVYSK